MPPRNAFQLMLDRFAGQADCPIIQQEQVGLAVGPFILHGVFAAGAVTSVDLTAVAAALPDPAMRRVFTANDPRALLVITHAQLRVASPTSVAISALIAKHCGLRWTPQGGAAIDEGLWAPFVGSLGPVSYDAAGAAVVDASILPAPSWKRFRFPWVVDMEMDTFTLATQADITAAIDWQLGLRGFMCNKSWAETRGWDRILPRKDYAQFLPNLPRG